jgi:hypothetical protein
LTYYYEEFANKEVKRKMNGRNEQTNVQKGWVQGVIKGSPLLAK